MGFEVLSHGISTVPWLSGKLSRAISNSIRIAV